MDHAGLQEHTFHYEIPNADGTWHEGRHTFNRQIDTTLPQKGDGTLLSEVMEIMGGIDVPDYLDAETRKVVASLHPGIESSMMKNELHPALRAQRQARDRLIAAEKRNAPAEELEQLKKEVEAASKRAEAFRGLRDREAANLQRLNRPETLTDARALSRLAGVLIRYGQFGLAAQALLREMALTGDLRGGQEIIRLFMCAGQFKEARQLIDLIKSPGDYGAARAVATLLLLQNDPEGALKELDANGAPEQVCKDLVAIANHRLGRRDEYEKALEDIHNRESQFRVLVAVGEIDRAVRAPPPGNRGTSIGMRAQAALSRHPIVRAAQRFEELRATAEWQYVEQMHSSKGYGWDFSFLDLEAEGPGNVPIPNLTGKELQELIEHAYRPR
jgi:hypothetical protein